MFVMYAAMGRRRWLMRAAMLKPLTIMDVEWNKENGMNAPSNQASIENGDRVIRATPLSPLKPTNPRRRMPGIRAFPMQAAVEKGRGHDDA